MEWTELGRTGIRIPRICVGCMTFGERSADFHQWTLGYGDSRDLIRVALEEGACFFDTANCYSHGTSEEFLGRALRELGARRDEVVIASKVYFNEGQLSALAIAREAEGTLRRLGTDYLDLYLIHRFDYGHPPEETMAALDALVRAGKVRALGASSMYGYQFHNLQLCADRLGLTPFSALQNHYNLLYREDERELIPVARQYGVSLIPYSPLASGHLCHAEWDYRSLRSGTDRARRQKYDATREQDQVIVSRVAEMAARLGVGMAEVALGWLWGRGVAAPIVGPADPVRFRQLLRAQPLRLGEGEMRFLEEPYRAHEVVGALPEGQVVVP
ncbi:MAG: aldo/keto reductase [Succinivibrionaceae bacterium]|nr:aldo/keto reductase [Succinivibrionaceae bacterium]